MWSLMNPPTNNLSKFWGNARSGVDLLFYNKSQLASAKIDFSSSGSHPSSLYLFSLALSVDIEEPNVSSLQKKEKKFLNLSLPQT